MYPVLCVYVCVSVCGQFSIRDIALSSMFLSAQNYPIKEPEGCDREREREGKGGRGIQFYCLNNTAFDKQVHEDT